jgi:hypothetical protein
MVLIVLEFLCFMVAGTIFLVLAIKAIKKRLLVSPFYGVVILLMYYIVILCKRQMTAA